MSRPLDAPINDRADFVTFTEGVDVTFPHRGDYVYSVFDSANMLVERGRLKVILDAKEFSAYNVIQTNFVYEGE